MNYAIEAENLRMVYTKDLRVAGSSDEAIRDVSFKVKPQEFVCVVGPSGSGKTSLLKLLSGINKLTSGKLTVNGRTGIVFQEPVLLPWRTVLDNVLLPVELRYDKKDYLSRAYQLLNLVGLSGQYNRYPYQLSGGMQQRVAICRALIYNAPILLMDEPFSALDAMLREQLNLEILRIWKELKLTVIFVTHNLQEAVFLSDKIIALSGHPATVKANFDVTLPRPRKLNIINTESFGAHVAALREILGVGKYEEDDE